MSVEITAALVKELRERTGAGMMDCKKALQESGGDIDAAIEAMRKSGVAKAAKKAGRIAAEGVIVLREADNGAEAIAVEVNCETDFVAKDESFAAFAAEVAGAVLAHAPADVEALGALKLPDGTTVEETRQALVGKLGENISIRRFVRLKSKGGRIGSYLHGTRIGVLVDLTGGEADLGKDLAMHVAASRPVCVAEADVPADLLEKEREIFRAQAAESGKAPEIVEKMVVGRVRKFLQECTLLGQPFVKDPDMSVEKLLKQQGASVNAFVRLEVGEGIEKKADNFADEVMAQARGA